MRQRKNSLISGPKNQSKEKFSNSQITSRWSVGLRQISGLKKIGTNGTKKSLQTSACKDYHTTF